MKAQMGRLGWLGVLLCLLAECTGARPGDPRPATEDATTAFVHVNLVPMTGEMVEKEQTVLIAGDRIVAVGPGRSVRLPEGVTIIDGAGAFLMPGLADMHVHTREDWESDAWPVSPLLLYLANGVTTIRDFGPSGRELTYARDWAGEIAAGDRVGPTIYTSGKILFASPLSDPEALVRENYELGFDFLKLYSYLSVEDFQGAMVTAGELGMYTAGHVPYAVALDEALAAGLDEIAHVEELLPELITFDRERQLEPDEWVPYLAAAAVQQFDVAVAFDEPAFAERYGEAMARSVEQLRSAGAVVCTTMVIDDVVQRKLFDTRRFLERPQNGYLPAGYLELLRRGKEKHQLQCQGMEALCAFKVDVDRWLLSRLHQGGVALVLGTDSGTGGMGIVPGFAVHDELQILVENGFTPYEAIAAATVDAAAVVEEMVGEGDFGTIEAGKRADLLLVDGNPLEDVGAIRELRGVMAAGRWYSRERVDQMLATK